MGSNANPNHPGSHIRVAVIGAGALGLMAMKNFQDDGFDVTGYERREYVGGLWKDREPGDPNISVHSTTVFNTSKYRLAVSDFPVSDDADDFPTAKQLHEYLCSYAARFGIDKKYKLSTHVLSIRRVKARECWAIESVNKSGKKSVDYYDKVAIATGNFHSPRWPNIEGMEKFEGEVFHSIDYHDDASRFEGKRVLLIGLHATAQDITESLWENGAEKVYCSHRSGLIMVPRYDKEGSVFDRAQPLLFVFIVAFLDKWLPGVWIWLLDTVCKKMEKAGFPDLPESWGLGNAPSLAVSTPLCGDKLYKRLESGFAEPVPAIQHVTGARSVVLKDGREISHIDVIIYCTGYHFNLPQGLIPVDEENRSDLFDPYPGFKGEHDEVAICPNYYRNIFPCHPDEKIRNSLALLGHSGFPYPGFLQFELTGMAVSQIWLGNSSLPSLSEMKAWVKGRDEYRAAWMKKYSGKPDGTFYTGFLPFGDQITWLDETAGTGIFENLGWSWFNRKAWALWWKDREFYKTINNGLCTPTIFRLFDMGKRKALDYDLCKKMIIRDNERVEESRVKRKKVMDKEAELEGKKTK